YKNTLAQGHAVWRASSIFSRAETLDANYKQCTSMNDEELRYGMRCRYLRDELVELPPGGRVIRTLVRNDGLKHRNVTCAFIVRSDGDPGETHQPDGVGGASFSGILVVRCFGVCCDSTLTVRLRLSVAVGDTTVCSRAWMEGVEITEEESAIRFAGILRLGDFETGATSAQLVEVRLQFDIKAAAPSFLLVPRVPTFQWTLLNDEEKQMVEVNCSDGALCAERSLLMRESSLWKSRLSNSDSNSVDCSEFSQSDMKVFLFYLQTQLFFDLARFDTFNSMAQISVRYSVSGIVKRCAMFVNDCVLLAEAGNRQSAGATSAATEATAPSGGSQQSVSSKVRWTPDDLVAIWRTTVSYLGEDGLGKVLMRLISQSSYSEIVNLSSFQQLDALTKSQFYHQFLLCKESSRGMATGGAPAAAPIS
ncbi:hypothetical protein BOX15_Mlig015546g1, partial [Macrostomum lignano]